MLHLIVVLVLVLAACLALFVGARLVLAAVDIYLRFLTIVSDTLFWRPLFWLLKQLIPQKHAPRQQRLTQASRPLNAG